METYTGTIHKTYRYKLQPTPAQTQALEQRRTRWGRGQGTGATYDQQKAELPDLQAACPE
jgi:hypothetical protein